MSKRRLLFYRLESGFHTLVVDPSGKCWDTFSTLEEAEALCPPPYADSKGEQCIKAAGLAMKQLSFNFLQDFLLSTNHVLIRREHHGGDVLR